VVALDKKLQLSVIITIANYMWNWIAKFYIIFSVLLHNFLPSSVLCKIQGSLGSNNECGGVLGYAAIEFGVSALHSADASSRGHIF
jgi:hypothetical protein